MDLDKKSDNAIDDSTELKEKLDECERKLNGIISFLKSHGVDDKRDLTVKKCDFVELKLKHAKIGLCSCVSDYGALTVFACLCADLEVLEKHLSFRFKDYQSM